MRCVLEEKPETPKGWIALALVLPKEGDLSAWFWAFLADVHELDPARVPQAPPRLDVVDRQHAPDYGPVVSTRP